NGGAAAAVRPAGQRANQDEEDQRLSGDRRETGKGGLEEKISMTSQEKCAINFSTGFGTQPVSIHLIASQHKNHLEPRKRTHEAAMFLSKAGHGLRRDKRKVHTGFQQEAIAPRKLVQVETLGMAHKVGDGPFVLRNHDECGMAGKALS